MSWNLGDILDAVAEALPPETSALLYGTQTVSWADFDRRSNNLAQQLLARGARSGDKVAFYLRNQPAYLETLAACVKARLVHVNVNFRYAEEELHYIFENSDASFVVFAGEFGELVSKLRPRLPDSIGYFQVDDGAPRTAFAEDFDGVCEEGNGRALGIERAPDDLLFLYTGGTTGMPKGVMWPQQDLWQALGQGAGADGVAPDSLAEHVANVRSRGPGTRQLPACPLMHGTGLFTALSTLLNGGTVVTLEGKNFDAHELWQTVSQHRVNSIAIVGDAFARPMLTALGEKPGAYDLSSLQVVLSSGVMWSHEIKKHFLRLHPGAMLVDAFGSSEAVGFGRSVMTAAGEVKTAKFEIGDRVKVFDEQDREVEPGSGRPGYVARCGAIPLGYYKDAEKTASTFREIDGIRYSIPGDWCTVDADGTLNLLGRGSVCINTAGEKVYPEEVEEILKQHASVEDALVVGVPDEKWGQAVTGVVQLHPGERFDEDALREHVRARLAGFKAPKRVLAMDDLQRAANGKADYKGVTEFAKQQLGIA